MIFRAVWDFFNSPTALYLAFALVFGTYIIYRVLRNAKIKHLMADERFEDAKLFASAMTTPMAITPKGHLGFVLSPFAKPLIIHMKDILGYEIFFDGHSVERSGLVGKKGQVFENIFALMAIRLQEKTRKIIMAFFMSDETILNVYLFNGSKKLAFAMRDSTKNEMQQLFNTLEEVEKKIKKK
jgi:hypothetical protein